MSQTRMLQPSQSQTADSRPPETQITINVNGVPVTPLQRIFLQRDYRLGVAIRFMTDFPIELSGRVSSSHILNSNLKYVDLDLDSN